MGADLSNLQLSAVHAESPENANILLEKAKSRFKSVGFSMVTDVTPVIGAHVGPGTIGIAYFAGN